MTKPPLGVRRMRSVGNRVTRHRPSGHVRLPGNASTPTPISGDPQFHMTVIPKRSYPAALTLQRELVGGISFFRVVNP
jgi:hypothetical protein